MCLLIFAYSADPRYPLVVAANRDEFHARSTAASTFWPEHPNLLAGRDLEQGGTWMGITRQGRFAAITNYRDPAWDPARTIPAPRSRGELPLDFLTGSQEPESYLLALGSRSEEYAGFNLLVGTLDSLWYLTNSRASQGSEPLRLVPGFYGLSNAQLDTPWPKVVLGKNRLQTLLLQNALQHEMLCAVVGDRHLANPQDLQRQGLDAGMDQVLSAQFITTKSYGTRSSTSMWIDGDNRVSWRESSFDPLGGVVGQREETFALIASGT